jgi:hypothetical protein
VEDQQAQLQDDQSMDEDHMHGGQIVEAVGAKLVHVEDNGNGGVLRVSQLSESSLENTMEMSKGVGKKSSKKGPSNSNRQIPQQIGVPKFCQLAASMVEAGRRRKEQIRKNSKIGGPVIEGGQSCVKQLPLGLPLSTEVEEAPAINLEVVLPLPGSGVNLLLDSDGVSAQDSTSDGGGVERLERRKQKF